MITSSKTSSAPCASQSRLQRLEEAVARRHDAHVPGDWLDDDGGDGAGVRLEDRLDGRGVVVGGEQRLRGEGGGHAGRVRQPEGGDAGAGSGQQAVRVAVVAALELHDQIAPGGGAGEPQRAHHRLGPGVDEAHHLHRGQRLDDQLRQLQLGLRRRAEGGAARRRLRHRIDDRRVRVAEDQRTERSEVVDVLVAVGVGDDRARTAGEHDRVAADGAVGARGRVDAAGEHGPRPRHQRARALEWAACRLGAHGATALRSGTPSASATSDSSVTSRAGVGKSSASSASSSRRTQATGSPAWSAPSTSACGESPT